jgi:hypothetical protein
MTFDPFQPVLPTRIYAPIGRQVNLYFENAIASTRRLPIDIDCSVGSQYGEQWLWNVQQEFWSERLRFDVLDPDYLNERDPLGSAEILLESAPMPSATSVPILLIGDSIMAGGVPGQYVLDQSGGITPVLLGTKGTGANKHEANSGWRVGNYAEPTGSLVALNSFIAPGGTRFNFSHWLGTVGQVPRLIHIGLGINAMFHLKRDELVVEECARDLDKLDRMIGLTPDPTYGSIRAGAPNAGVVIAMPTPPAFSQDGFGLVTKSAQYRDRYKRNHAICCWMIRERYKGLESERIFIDGWNVFVDPVNSFGYNTTTPNAVDNEQIKRADDTVHGTDVSKLVGQAIWRTGNALVSRALV